MLTSILASILTPYVDEMIEFRCNSSDTD